MNITKRQLKELIKESQKTIRVCVPDSDYYARSTDFSTRDITFICPQMLLSNLDSLDLDNLEDD